jgi:hypothetical protein
VEGRIVLGAFALRGVARPDPEDRLAPGFVKRSP